MPDPRSMPTITDELRPLSIDGILLLSDACSAGFDPRALRRAAERGEFTRIRRGVYAITAGWIVLSPRDRHRLRVIAADLGLGAGRVFSHQSAAALHRLPILGDWPERVHETRPRATGGRSTAGVISHDGPRDPSGLVDGIRVTTLPRTLLDLASVSTFASGVVSMDAALHAGRSSGESVVSLFELWQELERRGTARGTAAGRNVLEFGDGLADTPGESLSRVRIHQLGFPAPELQIVFRDSLGRMIVDFWWRDYDLVGEFDGLIKYHRAEYLAGKSIEDVVIEEKRREDRLRRVGPRVARWTWDDALRGLPLAQILMDAGLPRVRRPTR